MKIRDSGGDLESKVRKNNFMKRLRGLATPFVLAAGILVPSYLARADESSPTPIFTHDVYGKQVRTLDEAKRNLDDLSSKNKEVGTYENMVRAANVLNREAGYEVADSSTGRLVPNLAPIFASGLMPALVVDFDTDSANYFLTTDVGFTHIGWKDTSSPPPEEALWPTMSWYSNGGLEASITNNPHPLRIHAFPGTYTDEINTFSDVQIIGHSKDVIPAGPISPGDSVPDPSVKGVVFASSTGRGIWCGDSCVLFNVIFEKNPLVTGFGSRMFVNVIGDNNLVMNNYFFNDDTNAIARAVFLASSAISGNVISRNVIKNFSTVQSQGTVIRRDSGISYPNLPVYEMNLFENNKVHVNVPDVGYITVNNDNLFLLSESKEEKLLKVLAPGEGGFQLQAGDGSTSQSIINFNNVMNQDSGLRITDIDTLLPYIEVVSSSGASPQASGIEIPSAQGVNPYSSFLILEPINQNFHPIYGISPGANAVPRKHWDQYSFSRDSPSEYLAHALGLNGRGRESNYLRSPLSFVVGAENYNSIDRLVGEK